MIPQRVVCAADNHVVMNTTQYWMDAEASNIKYRKCLRIRIVAFVNDNLETLISQRNRLQRRPAEMTFI